MSTRPRARLAAGTPWASLAARLIVGALLIYAGLPVIGDPARALLTVPAHQLLPPDIATGWSSAQPVVEVALGALLVTGLVTRFTAILTGLLLLAFMGGVASVWAHGIATDCGCSATTAAGQAQYLVEMLRYTGLLALNGVIIAWPPGRFAADHLLGLTRPGPT